MKGTAIILSLVLLISSMRPCSDGHNTEDRYQDSASTDHNHQNDSDDSCPITCICKCCGIAIAYQPTQTFDFKSNADISTTDFSTYQTNYRFDFHSNIWQPPQLISQSKDENVEKKIS